MVGESSQIKRVVLFIVVVLFMVFIFNFYGTKRAEKNQSNFFEISLDGEVLKVTGGSLATVVYLKDGSKFLFKPKYNEGLGCSFSTCVQENDIVQKSINSNIIYVVMKGSRDTVIFESR